MRDLSSESVVLLIRERVNFLGYGLSPNWLGYCDRNQPFSIELATKIIDEYNKYFSLENLIVVSALARLDGAVVDDDPNVSAHLVKVSDQLVGNGLVKPVTDSEAFFDDFDDFMGNPKFISKRELSKELFSQISLACFVDSSIEGHCFFYDFVNNLISYPHDDTGYGFIGPSNNGIDSVLTEFSKSVNSIGGFSFHFKRSSC